MPGTYAQIYCLQVLLNNTGLVVRTSMMQSYCLQVLIRKAGIVWMHVPQDNLITMDFTNPARITVMSGMCLHQLQMITMDYILPVTSISLTYIPQVLIIILNYPGPMGSCMSHVSKISTKAIQALITTLMCIAPVKKYPPPFISPDLDVQGIRIILQLILLKNIGPQ